MLGGGIPTGRALLVRGPEGVGKSRFGASFLAAGGTEACLFAAVEESLPSVRDSLSLPDDATVAALTGGDAGVEYETADGTETLAVEALLDRLGAPGLDRVVLDGVAGLSALGDGSGVDLLAALLARFEANDTAALLTGPPDGDSAVDRRVGGVVDCWREEHEGDARPFCRVRKLRGRAHDTRRHALHHGADGVSVAAREWATHDRTVPTGIGSFDELTGGFVEGGTSVFEHDGVADHWPFTAALCARAVERGDPVVLVTAPGTLRGRVNDLLEEQVGHVRGLMADGDLYLIDPVSQSPGSPALTTLPESAVVLEAQTGSIQSAIRALIDELGEEDVVGVLEHAAIEHLVDEDQARRLFYWATGTLRNVPGDLSLVLTADRNLAGERLSAFFTGAADQVVRTWRGADELQYLSVPKSPAGTPGHTRVVEPVGAPPYVRLR